MVSVAVTGLIWLTVWIVIIIVVVNVSCGANPIFRTLLIAITVASLPLYVFFFQPWYSNQKRAENNSKRLQRDADVTNKFGQICSSPSTTQIYRSLENREPIHLLVTTSYGKDFAEGRALPTPVKSFAERSSLDFNVSEGCWAKGKFDEKCLPSNIGEVDREIVSRSCFYVNPNSSDHCQRSIFRISKNGPTQQIEKSEASHLLVVRDYELVYSKTNSELQPDIVRFKVDLLDRATRDLIAETYIYKRQWISNDTSRQGALYCRDIDVQIAEFLSRALPSK